MSCTRNSDYHIGESNSIIGVSEDLDKNILVSHVREQTWDHIVRKMTQMCGSFTANVLYYAEPFSKGDLNSTKGKQTFDFQSTTQAKTMCSRTILACNQLCMYAAVCLWFDQYIQKKLVIVKDRNLPQTTSRIRHTEKVQLLRKTRCETAKTAKPVLQARLQDLTNVAARFYGISFWQNWKTESWNSLCLLESATGTPLRSDVHVFSDSARTMGDQDL